MNGWYISSPCLTDGNMSSMCTPLTNNDIPRLVLFRHFVCHSAFAVCHTANDEEYESRSRAGLTSATRPIVASSSTLYIEVLLAEIVSTVKRSMRWASNTWQVRQRHDHRAYPHSYKTDTASGPACSHRRPRWCPSDTASISTADMSALTLAPYDSMPDTTCTVVGACSSTK